MRILSVINSLDPGGAENLLLRQLAMRPAHWQCAVACIDQRGALADEAERSGLPVTLAAGRARLDLRRILRLRKIIRKWQPDVVHLHLPRSGFFGRLACAGLHKIPVVYTEHNLWEMYSRGTRLLNASTYPLNDVVIAVSEAVKQSTLAHVPSARFSRPPVVVRNGVDVPCIERAALERDAARAALGLPRDALVVGNIGNLFQRKGHRYLLEAAAQVTRRHPHCHFAVIGSGDQLPELSAMRRSLNLEGRVRLITGVPDAARFIPAFDIFALPSLFEGLPVALLEAMALRMPCVASRVGGVPEVIEHGTSGMLIPPRDASGLSSALETLISEPDRRHFMGEKAQERVSEHYSLDRFLATHESLYTRLTRPALALDK